jgi:hypothetical protein
MIAAEAQQQMARTGAITALLTNRDNLGPALQQQLDTGMTGYMARLFGGGRWRKRQTKGLLATVGVSTHTAAAAHATAAALPHADESCCVHLMNKDRSS